MTCVLDIHDLTIEYPQRHSVKHTVEGANLTVRQGEIVGLVGQSGVGKSILVRGIMNLVPPPGRIVSGSICMFGRDMLTTPEAQLRQLRGKRVGVIVQNARSHLNPLISIGDQISNVYRAHEKVSRREAQEKAIEMLQNVGMPAPVQRYSAYPHELSGGMAQRAMIAMALICSPELLIADEPTSGLDVTIQDQILKLFRRSVAEQGAAGLLVSRDMGIVANFCDRVAVMFEGRIVEVSDVPSFFTEARHPHSMALIASASYNSSRPPESTDREEVMA